MVLLKNFKIITTYYRAVPGLKDDDLTKISIKLRLCYFEFLFLQIDQNTYQIK